MENDKLKDEIYITEAMLQFALMHCDEEEAERLREKLRRLRGWEK